MKVVDLNVLLYAVNADAPQHERARKWWEAALNGDERIGLGWAVLIGFLRISTRPGVLPRPLQATQALDVVGEWLEHPLVDRLAPGDRHWTIFRRLIDAAGTAGNLTTDAHLAALAIEFDATLYTTDGDYERFQSLKFKDPLA